MELFAVDDEVKLAELAHESLEVEAALLQEDDVLVSHCLLGWHLGQKDAGPALLQALLEEEEFIVAALDLKVSLRVLALDDIHDMAAMILWISD